MTRGSPPRNRLVFIHVPKAAGTTLRQVIARHYPAEQVLATDVPVTLSVEQRSRLRVVMGHVPFGTQAQLPGPVDVIAVLRDPVERIASLYDYVRLRPHHAWHALAVGRSLADFAACGIPAVRNAQVRQLSGRAETSRATLDLAAHHLTHAMTAFGLAERFDESLVLMKRALGWRGIYHRRLNVTPGRPARRQISSAAVACIEAENALDLELYARASRAFDDVVRAQDESFHRAVRGLRRLNPIYRAVSDRLHAAAPLLPGRVRTLVRSGLTTLRG